MPTLCSGSPGLSTGRANALHLQLTRQLLRKGNAVVATARVPSKAAELQRLAGESSGKLTITQLDVSQPEQIEVGK